MTSLAEIRAKLAQQENRGGGGESGPNASYPFWNIPDDATAVMRFLPDADESNTFFWKERLIYKLPFAGVKGDTSSRPIIVQVPCVEMYGEKCPILEEVKPFFNNASTEDLGRTYWKKKSWVFQGFVVENPLETDKVPENPIRRFVISKQVFDIVKEALLDPELEEMPTDYVKGLDFRLKKTKNGQGFANYTSSSWARRERPLSDEEMNAVNAHGLFNLADYLPKVPDETTRKVMFEMFESSIAGEAYDVERFGAYFKAPGFDSNVAKPSVTVPASTPAPAPAPAAPVAEAASDVPFDVDPAPAAPAPAPAAPAAEPAAAPAPDAANILAMIRERQGG